MNEEMHRTAPVKQSKEKTDINSGNLLIRPAKKVEGKYFKRLLSDVQEMLKDVKTSFSEDVISERNI